MSIVLATQTDKQIVIAADNRLIESDNSLKSDDARKVHVINGHLAVASAGNRLGDLLISNIEKDINHFNIFIEDVVEIVKNFYKDKDNMLLRLPVSYIIGGAAKNGANGIVCIFVKNGVPTIEECLEVLLRPSDLSQKECNEIYYNNKGVYKETYHEKTIKEIAKISNVVSSSCDIWRFDIDNCVGTFEHIS